MYHLKYFTKPVYSFPRIRDHATLVIMSLRFLSPLFKSRFIYFVWLMISFIFNKQCIIQRVRLTKRESNVFGRLWWIFADSMKVNLNAWQNQCNSFPKRLIMNKILRVVCVKYLYVYWESVHTDWIPVMILV